MARQKKINITLTTAEAERIVYALSKAEAWTESTEAMDVRLIKRIGEKLDSRTEPSDA